LAGAVCGTAAHALGDPAVFSLAEKDLFHYQASASCAGFSADGLPAGSHFDSSTGLFTWLPDFGSAGSSTVSFSCAGAPAGTAPEQLRLEVAPSAPVYLKGNTPKVTLVAARTAASSAQSNDQQSLASMLGVYGLTVETVDDLAAAFAAHTVGDILVVPSYLARSLDAATVQKVVSYLEAGGSVLCFGRSPLSEALGIGYAGAPLTVTDFVDYLNPGLPLVWTGGENVEPFVVQAADSVLAVDKGTLTPIMVARSRGKGRLLYVGTDYYDRFSVYGTKGHPYLLYHLVDAFRLNPRVSAASIDAYFDPGNYDLSQVYIEDIVRSWAERGISTVYAAAWHYWINEQTGQEWTFGYQHFIEVCHLWGIKVYPWFAIPHVSQKFWFTRPECREQTASTGETYLSWRLNVNLQNQSCLASALQFVDDVISAYDWDGVNLAEIYYDFDDIAHFTPMNADLRSNYAALSGFDPAAFFDPASPHYYLADPTAWSAFLSYRTGIVTGLHKSFLDRIYGNPKAGNLDVMLTAVDSLNQNYPDLQFPPGYAGSLDLGVDLPAILDGLGSRNFQLQVEDAWPFWSSNPFRYRDFKASYLSRFDRFRQDESALMFDVNVVANAHNLGGGSLPLFNFPALIQTGQEFSLLLKNLFSDSSRLALFSEHSVERVDMERLRWALAGDTVFSQSGADSASFTARRTTKLEANPAFYSVLLDGKTWPAWSSVDGSVLLPVGSHQISFRTDQSYSGIRVSGLSCALEDAGTFPGGVSVRYASPQQKAVLTVEAFDKKDQEPFIVLVDGQPYAAAMYPFYGLYRFFLPRGSHEVRISVQRDLAAGNPVLSGATDISCNAPITVTFTNPIDPASLTAESLLVTDADNNRVPGRISYDADSMTATFTPLVPLSLATGYTVTVTPAVVDIYGRSLTSAKSLAFATDPFGDINGNKKVDLAAVLKYLRVVVGLEPQPDVPLTRILIAPINRATGKPQPQAGRTKVTLQDAVAALERVVGLW